jgi:hypothetical protein
LIKLHFSKTNAQENLLTLYNFALQEKKKPTNKQTNQNRTIEIKIKRKKNLHKDRKHPLDGVLHTVDLVPSKSFPQQCY